MKNIKIKSLLAILLTAVMLISMICIMPVSAADDEETTTITSGDFQYTVLTDGTAEIAKYTGSATDLTIPTDLDGKKVTRIGNYSFENNTTIKSLTIPTGIEIGNGAFRYCKIETLKLSDGVETIGSGAFSFCESLKALTLPDSVTTIDTFAFQDCKSLTSIKLSNKLEKISDFAFTGCEALTGINFPSSIKEIGQNAFAHCYGLTSVVIPGNVKIINTAAFSYCRNLSSVTLNEGIETISAYAFSTCTKLMEVTVPDSATEVVHMSLGYWWDDVTWNYLLVDGFVLKGYRGSAAESYAQEYGVTFVSIGDSILTPPTTAGPTEPTTAPAPGTVNTVYFKNTANFATPYAYYWSSATDSGPESWPGVAMEKVTDDVYKINVPAEYDMIIFSDKGNNKTLDLKIGGNNMIYDGSGWSVYADAPTEPTEASSETEPTEASSETEPSEASSETEPSEASSETEPTEASSETEPSEASSETKPTEASSETEPTEASSETEPTEASSETDPAPVFDYYVVGSPELFGANWAEDPANGMTKGDDGNYYLTIENAPAGTFGFKVKDSNGGWHPDGMGNDGSVTTTGGEKVIFCYNPDAGYAVVSTDGQVPTYPVPTKPTETEPKPTETQPTEPTECAHSKTTTTGKKTATYFEKGYTGDKVCADCGEVIVKGSKVDKKVLKTPKVTVKPAKNAIKVTYKKVKDAKGFKVTYKLGKKTYNKKFTLTKKELKKAKVTKTIKVEKSGKYKVTVKAFVTSGKKTAYSDATKTATAKVK